MISVAVHAVVEAPSASVALAADPAASEPVQLLWAAVPPSAHQPSVQAVALALAALQLGRPSA